jgi:(4-(4-[2-(gamma-L-glutamylamino)ethyl]phenoxymethyl)furan-2-yl)methanamine synthase
MKMVGWDIGGAHIKAVLLEDGVVAQALQLACPLWKGLDYAERAILSVLQSFQVVPFEVQHLVTMTGELVDLFPNRHQGVVQIADLSIRLLGDKTLFYASQHGFVSMSALVPLTDRIASANWHASAQCIAQTYPNALLVDIGSTTTDIIRIQQGAVATQASTDAERLQTGELLYTGVVRTPLMALAKQIMFKQQQQYVAAEYFATTGDVYRLSDDLSETDYSGDTADGGPKTQMACAMRLARMVGCDAEQAPLTTWIELAKTYKQIQLHDMTMAIKQQLNVSPKGLDTIIVAGAGTFLISALQPHFASYPFLAATDCIEASDAQLKRLCGVCFPAYAVAKLGQLSHGQHA